MQKLQTVVQRSLYTLLDHKRTLRYIKYIGMEWYLKHSGESVGGQSPSTAFFLTSVLCRVLSPAGSCTNRKLEETSSIYVQESDILLALFLECAYAPLGLRRMLSPIHLAKRGNGNFMFRLATPSYRGTLFKTVINIVSFVLVS